MTKYNHDETFTIGTVAELKSISAYTLRYYDKKGLLPKVFRDKNGIRQFTEEDLQWLDMIKCLKNTGMSLEQLKVFVDATYQGPQTLAARIALLKKQTEKINTHIAQQQSYLKQVNRKIKTLNDEDSLF
ncbi:MerR family transcriptional regulator [Leuconostoc sp. MS02]|uniref:MerR family transcriptional regulator n=1 Tax=Leuconostoc aquikimchii TaxID=3236804 RepID=A0ABV3S6W1_9LACO